MPFVQRISNSNHSDRLKISASQMLFGNMLNLDRGIFIKYPEPLVQKPLSNYISELPPSVQQTSTLQGPSINSDEFSASQSCSSNSNQRGYIQTTPSSVTTCPVVASQGPSSSNEPANQQGSKSADSEPKFLVNFAGVRAECGYPHKSKFNRITIPCESIDSAEFR